MLVQPRARNEGCRVRQGNRGQGLQQGLVVSDVNSQKITKE